MSKVSGPFAAAGSAPAIRTSDQSEQLGRWLRGCMPGSSWCLDARCWRSLPETFVAAFEAVLEDPGRAALGGDDAGVVVPRLAGVGRLRRRVGAARGVGGAARQADVGRAAGRADRRAGNARAVGVDDA